MVTAVTTCLSCGYLLGTKCSNTKACGGTVTSKPTALSNWILRCTCVTERAKESLHRHKDNCPRGRLGIPLPHGIMGRNMRQKRNELSVQIRTFTLSNNDLPAPYLKRIAADNSQWCWEPSRCCGLNPSPYPEVTWLSHTLHFLSGIILLDCLLQPTSRASGAEVTFAFSLTALEWELPQAVGEFFCFYF